MKNLKSYQGIFSREGVIIECPPNGLFHDARDIILTSLTGVSEMVNDDDEDARPLVVQKEQRLMKSIISYILCKINERADFISL